MMAAVQNGIDRCDIFIGVAAVADYRPAHAEESKIKKNDERVTLELVRNPDILSWVSAHHKRPFTVGFAAETNNPLEYARAKLASKNLDLIAVNHVSNQNNPFGSDQNQLVVISATDESDLGRKSKTQLAAELVGVIARKFHERHKTQNS